MSAWRPCVAVCATLLAAAPAAAQQPHPGEAQARRGAVARLIAVMTEQLARAVSDRPPAPASAAAPLKPCRELWDPDVRRIAEGPEMAWSYGGWLARGFAVIGDYGGLPLPLCFMPHHETLTTRQGRNLLTVNNEFIKERFRGRRAAGRYFDGYLLTGYPDPLENDTAMARRRAEWIQAQSPQPPCRFVPRADLAERRTAFQRKVYYTVQPSVGACPRRP
jgi:hypothetical protein